MDVKALAKSKRAHSLHHSKKHHPKQTAKAPTAGPVKAAVGEKQKGKQVKEKPEQSRGSKELPSNWERYNEELDLESEDVSQESMNKATNVVLPKSKGADYTHLISEAKAQSRTNYALEEFPIFDDILDDLNQGPGPLPSVRGQSLLSWITDDNFEVEDKGTDKYEASFLSLDLNALAEQLAKASLAERLFIEPDQLPPILYAELQKYEETKSDQDQATSGHEAVEDSIPWLDNVSEGKASFNRHQENASSDTSASSAYHVKGFENHVKDNTWQVEQKSRSSLSRSSSELETNSVAKTPSRFDAVSAEAELDALLDSFGETKSFESTSGIERSKDSSSLLSSSQPLKNGPYTVNSSAIAANLDDDIDELLKETSSFADITGASTSREIKVARNDIPSATNPVSKSKVLDDFDSWLDTI